MASTIGVQKSLQPGAAKQFTIQEGDQNVTYQQIPGQAPQEIGRGPKWNPNPAALVQVGLGKPLKESEAAATGRLTRAKQASEELRVLDKQGIDRLNKWDHFVSTLTSNEAARNFLVSDEGKRYIQSQDNWIENFGRTESGGVIGPDEYSSWRSIYFNAPDDPPEMKAMKSRARLAVEAGFEIGAGKGAELAQDWKKKLESEYKRLGISPTDIASSSSSNEPSLEELLEKY